MTTWEALASLSTAERSALLDAGRRRRFAKGEVIFHHGDPADSVHLLATGRVAIRVLTARGEQAILTVLGPGRIFGELALVDHGGHRTATVTALQEAETIVLRREQFTDLLRAHPEITEFLLASLASQVARLSDHLLDVLFSPVSRRVCARILVLDEEFDGQTLPITQEELALMVGATRATVNEVLQGLVKGGSIQLGRGHLQVLNREDLARRAR